MQVLDAGITVAKQGDVADAVYLCARGQLKVVLNANTQDEKLVNIMGTGE